MKACIINEFNVDRQKIDEKRFAQMIKALVFGGVKADYFSISSIKELQEIVYFQNPQIVYCANYFLLDSKMNQVSVHEFLLNQKIPYIGSSPQALQLTLSKTDLKTKWAENDLQTPSFTRVQKKDLEHFIHQIIPELQDYPYILKPNLEGNSRGLDEQCIAMNRNELNDKILKKIETYPDLLVEHFLGMDSELREYTVAMIGNGGQKLILPARIQLKKKKTIRIITTTDKDQHQTFATSVIEEPLHQNLCALAERAFSIAGVSDYSRCDILLFKNQFYTLEINGLPMIPDKWFEICAAAGNLDSVQYLNSIFLAGIVRNRRMGFVSLEIPEKMKRILPHAIYDQLVAQI